MKYLGLFLCLCLSGCVGLAVKSVHELPLPPNLSPARDYDLAHDTSYETMAKQLALNLMFLWDIPEGKTDIEFFALPDMYKNEGEQYTFYETELPKAGWQRDDNAFGVLGRWRLKHFGGTQTFVTTYLNLPQSSDALVVRMLYPVNK